LEKLDWKLWVDLYISLVKNPTSLSIIEKEQLEKLPTLFRLYAKQVFHDWKISTLDYLASFEKDKKTLESVKTALFSIELTFASDCAIESFSFQDLDFLSFILNCEKNAVFSKKAEYNDWVISILKILRFGVFSKQHPDICWKWVCCQLEKKLSQPIDVKSKSKQPSTSEEEKSNIVEFFSYISMILVFRQ
jgi:hypothetical protein